MCMLIGNPDRVAQQSTFLSVGESYIALGSSDLVNANYTRLVELAWYDQNEKYDYKTNTCNSPSAYTYFVIMDNAYS